ncbi:MAG: SpoIIE family protein phosphatase [Fibrobacteria bacterium]|nr:SpoIIE family protein phosphatase [Fibrobacteria bacterium]
MSELALIGLLVALLAASGIWLVRVHRVLSIKRHLEAVFDLVDPVVVVSNSFRIVRANRAFADLVQRSWKGLLGHSLGDLLGTFLPPTELIAVTERKSFRDRRWNAPTGDRLFDIHVVPAGSHDGWVLHFQETTTLNQIRQELLARNAALGRLTQSLQGEIEMAREIQGGLLPRELPRVEGIEFVVRYLPSRPVGGDLYDVLPLEGNRLGIFIADVSGHGLPAAFEAALVRMSFLSRAQTGNSPAQVLAAMNRDLRQSLAVGHYATAFYGILDLDTLELRYCRASHPRPAILRKGGEVLQLGSQGLFLGIVDSARYKEAHINLVSGDRLCLFTDGYYEGLRRDGRRLGYEGFLTRLDAAPGDDLEAELVRIEDEFEPGSEEDGSEDDRTFLALNLRSAHPRKVARLLTRFPPGFAGIPSSFSTAQESWELVEQFADQLQKAGWPQKLVRKAQLAASELTVNAVVHGGRDRPDATARCVWSIESDRCLFAVEDDGPGFDPDRLPDPRAPERLTLDHGRGIFLVRRLVTELWLDHRGTTASFVLLSPPNDPPQEA